MGSKAAGILPLVTLGAFALPGIGPAISTALGLSQAAAGGSAAAAGVLPTAGGLLNLAPPAVASVDLSTGGLLAGLANIAGAVDEDAGFALQEAEQRLSLAQQQRDAERRFEKELARQNNLLAARGVQANSGSARRLAEGTAKARHSALLDLAGAAGLDNDELRLKRGSARRKRTAALPGLLDLRLPDIELWKYETQA